VTGSDPDYGYASRLGIIAAVLVAAPFALTLLHPTGTPLGEAARRSGALLVMGIFVVVMPVMVSGWSGAAAAEAPTFLLISLLAIWLTYLGFGSIGVGLPVRVGTVRGARHADEPRTAAADDHRGGVLHR
jgi:ABC-type transport system involved in cytochrome c biogenesis permease component